MPISTSRTIQGTASPAGRSPPEMSGQACTKVCVPMSVTATAAPKVVPSRTSLKTRVSEEYQEWYECEQQAGKWKDHDTNERIALTEEVEAGWAERGSHVLEDQPQHDAGNESPTHREPDHERGLVLVDVDRVQIQKDEERHQGGGNGQRDREQPSERKTHDRREAERQRDTEIRHVGVRQLGKQARHHVDRPRALAGRRRELPPTAPLGRDRVFVERVSAAHAERGRGNVAAALGAGDVSCGRFVLGHVGSGRRWLSTC